MRSKPSCVSFAPCVSTAAMGAGTSACVIQSYVMTTSPTWSVAIARSVPSPIVTSSSAGKQPPPPPQHVDFEQERPQLSTPTPQHSEQVLFEMQPQMFAPPPPHVFGDVQLGPHETFPPHPFGTVPQLAPLGHCPVGVHPHACAVPPPPHDC